MKNGDGGGAGRQFEDFALVVGAAREGRTIKIAAAVHHERTFGGGAVSVVARICAGCSCETEERAVTQQHALLESLHPVDVRPCALLDSLKPRTTPPLRGGENLLTLRIDP